MKNRLALIVSTLAAIVAVSACSPPSTTPSDIKVFQPIVDPNSGATVSGRVYVHSADGVVPAAGARIFGWIETASGGSTTGLIVTDADGNYSFVPGINATRVRVNAMSAGLYQPCAVTVDSPAGGATRDVHLIADLALLGVNLPDAFMQQGSLLTGVVFETTAQGRQPLANAAIDLDGLGGNGLLIANTLTDGEGRFALCGLSDAAGLYLSAVKDGYELWSTTQLGGFSHVEIELRSK